jgi:hypothetical protein
MVFTFFDFHSNFADGIGSTVESLVCCVKECSDSINRRGNHTRAITDWLVD